MNRELTQPAPGTEGFDSVQLLSSGIQIYYPLSKDFQTQVGIFFNFIDDIEIWIQQSVIPNQFVSQIKIINLKVPSALGFLFFFLGLATFLLKSAIEGNRNAATEALEELKSRIDTMIDQKAGKARQGK